MSEESSYKLLRIGGITVLGVALTSLIHYLRHREQTIEHLTSIKQIGEELAFVRQTSQKSPIVKKAQTSGWGTLLVSNIEEDDGLLAELRLMSTLAAEFEKVNNLIVDLELSDVRIIKNPVIQQGTKKLRREGYMNPNAVTVPGTFVLNNARVFTGQLLYFSKKWLRAGARSTIFFRPAEVKAAIVTCGGLAPGINTLIKELVVCLKSNYKVPTVVGIKYSFHGLIKDKLEELDTETVRSIHHVGGNYLGFYRSEEKPTEIIDKLIENKINQLYVIGGMGSIALCNILHAQIKRRKLEIALCVIPKSTTNDIPIIDRSFGFDTAIEETQRAIEAGYNESHSHFNGVGIVRVLGRQSGFLAIQSCIAARNCQACLVPEFSFDLAGDKGLMAYVEKRMRLGKNSLIVLSEGANQSLRDYHLKVIGAQWDGVPIKQDVGLVIKRELTGYLNNKGYDATVKYIDPTYMVRATPANAFDTKMCCQVAQSSIEGVMCGYTCFASGHVANKNVMIPLHEFISGNYSTKVLKHSREWQRLLATTGQPSFLND